MPKRTLYSRCRCGSGKVYKDCCRQNQSLETKLKKIMPSVKLGKPDFTKQKMSQILSDFIDEFTSDEIDLLEQESILAMSCLAWNLSFTEQKALIKSEILKCYNLIGVGKGSLQEFQSIIETMVAKKEREYPHIQRFIAAWELKKTGGRVRLNVASIER